MNEFGPVAVKEMKAEAAQPEKEAQEPALAEDHEGNKEKDELLLLKSVSELMAPEAKPGERQLTLMSALPVRESREAFRGEEGKAGEIVSREIEKLLRRLDEEPAAEEEDNYPEMFSLDSEAQREELAWDETVLADGTGLSFVSSDDHQLLNQLFEVVQEVPELSAMDRDEEISQDPVDTANTAQDQERESDLPAPADWQGSAGEPHFDEMAFSPLMAMGSSLVKMVSLIWFEQDFMEPEPEPAPEPPAVEESPAITADPLDIPETIDVSDLMSSEEEPAVEEPVAEVPREKTDDRASEAKPEPAPAVVPEPEAQAAAPVLEGPAPKEMAPVIQQAAFVTSLTLAPQPVMEKVAQVRAEAKSDSFGRAMEKAFSSYKPIYTQFVEKIVTPTVILSASYAAPPRLPTYTPSYAAYEPLRREPAFLSEKFVYSSYSPSSFRYAFGSTAAGYSGYDSRDRKKKRRYFGVE